MCREAPAFLADAPDATVTMGAFLDARGYGAAFRNWYLVPQVAAVWSSSAADVLSFPASTFITFCVNHSLLQLIDRPQWRTVSRRSAEYVRRLVGALDPATTTIKLSTSVESVVPLRPRGGGTASSSSTVIVRDAAGGVAEFDHVVFGAHPDTVRDMLLRGCSGGGSGADENTAATTTTACAALDAFVYSSNTAVLHRDPSLMPARRSVWASWNYMGRWGADATAAAAAASAAPEPCCVTYYLNLLQNLPPGTPDTFLTLNPTSGGGAPPDPRSVISTMAYAHPQYTVNTVAAQGVLADVQGGGHMWFAGAYTGYGFHEDAITSGLRVAHAIVGVRPRWWDTPMYTTPSLLLLSGAAGASAPSAAEAVRVLKASGGPYWRDNLGNGGLVGRATSEVAGIAVALRRAAATATAASSSSSSAAAALVAKGSKGASIVSSGDSSSSGGTVSDGGVTGHMLVSPGDVLFAYRRLVGHAQEAASAASSSSSSGGGGVGSVAHSTAGGPAGAVNCVTTVPSSSLSSLRAAGLASPFSSSACTSSSSTNTTAFSRASSHESSDDSEEAVSGEEQEREDAAADGGQLSPPPLSVSAATPAGSSNAARPTLRNRRTGTQGAGASLYIRAGSSGSGGSITTSTAAAAAAAASERVNVPTPGANSTITWSNTAPVPHVSGAMAVSALRSGSSASVSRHNAADASTLLTGHFTDVRAFKSSAVAGAIAAATAAASAAHSGPRSGSTAAPLLGDRSRTSTSTTPLGDRMAGGVGGYTVQEAPLQAPDAHPSLLSWAMQAASYAAAHIAASPVLAFLRGSVRIGCLCVRTPDGVDTLIGDPSALPPLRARLRVHSWAFFARAALEADIGLARSFIAGEWTTDDLTALFNVFAVNRERATFRTYGLWSAWLGASLNYASFALRLDNSIANSRRNISAHYDLSNDLFTAFLDPRSMMYSCGFFDCKRRIVQEVDLARSECSSSGGGGSVRAARAAAGATGESAILIPVAASSSRTTSAGPAAARPSPGGGSSNSGGGNAAAPRPQQRVELIFDGSLEEAQTRKLDHLIARSCVQPHHTVLDLGFGWGGLSIRLAQSVGCRVHGITLSKEQLELATERVAAAGVAHLVTFEIVDYRDFAKAHRGKAAAAAAVVVDGLIRRVQICIQALLYGAILCAFPRALCTLARTCTRAPIH